MKCYIKDYPRPQFVRKNWENLNGTWDFAFDDQNIGEHEKWFRHSNASLQINVPFTYETRLSGIHDETRHDNLWYWKKIHVDIKRLQKDNYILHFEGADFITKLWVNGQYAGSHRGGYSRFSFDITNLLLNGENILTVKIEDSFDIQQPRGKQRWISSNFGCWYVQTSGIWKTVWSEYVPKINLSHIKMTPDLQNYQLILETDIQAPESHLNEELTLETSISYKGELINKTSTSLLFHHSKIVIDMFAQRPVQFAWDEITWTPEHPNLFDIEFTLSEHGMLLDKIESYFAMREIQIDGANILLNGHPIYQRLILDQGYWKDSHLTPPSEKALIEDIDKIHALGYNGVRKHQKTEDERFLYWCDVKGMLVWSEFPSAYRFSDYAITEFTTEWLDVVKQNYNHPCIITWVPFNESWGIGKVRTRQDQQHFTEAIYHLTKSIDKYRPVIVNDGWEHTLSDIITLHDYVSDGDIFTQRYLHHQNEILNATIYHNCDYPAFSKGFEYKGQPVIISEYGGIAFNNDDSGWGYGDKVTDKNTFIQRFDHITTAIKKLPYICGYCYTQVSDVQQEINGLMDSERNFKITPDIIKEINERPVNCLTH